MLSDEQIILRRLEKLDQYVQLLKKLVSNHVGKFVADPFVHGNAERYLQLAIQTCLDIGNYILANRKIKAPDNYRDIFIFLGENDIISMELAQKMAPLAGLRNILVHDYLDIDLEKIHALLESNLSDFSRFAQEISENVLK
ncbi:MAG: DUF86 domain-containing protein [Candidatus Lokiarchaeota archaeon]|nr:DUF86 domain-containing protein [Candidatus Lokiarchaeota archaeon]